MINSTNTVQIDGVELKNSDFLGAFANKNDDKFSRWVVRPLALLAAIGVGVAALFARAFFVLVSLALLPLLAVAIWAMKTKLERDLAAADPVVATQEVEPTEADVDGQSAS